VGGSFERSHVLNQIILHLMMKNFVADILKHDEKISKLHGHLVINSGKRILVIIG
jgi:hypothetical protein